MNWLYKYLEDLEFFEDLDGAAGAAGGAATAPQELMIAVPEEEARTTTL